MATKSSNLIVNYLPQNMTDRELYSMFVTIGPVESCRVMKDFKTGYSYGFGFVNYSRPEDAERAIQQLNGQEIFNKRIKVSYARPSGEDIKETNLYVTNLPRHFKEDDLHELFRPYGTIVQKNLLLDKLTGLPRGVAFVRFDRREEAQEAIRNLDGQIPEGGNERLSVRVAEEHGKQKAAYYAGWQAGLQQSRDLEADFLETDQTGSLNTEEKQELENISCSAPLLNKIIVMARDESVFWPQLKAMLTRNLLLKLRKKKKTISEIVMPFYFLGFAVMISNIIPNPNFPRVDKPRQEVDLFNFFKDLKIHTNFTVAVAPNSTEVMTFLDEINLTLNKTTNTTSLDFIFYHSEKRLLKKYLRDPKLFHFGLVFNGTKDLSSTLKYKILINPVLGNCPDLGTLYAEPSACRRLPVTSDIDYNNPNQNNTQMSSSDRDQANPPDCPADLYFKSGFAAIQMLVDYTKIRVSLRDRSMGVPNITLNILPKEAFTADWLLRVRIIPIYMVMATSQFINYLLILIVGEKEKRIKAGMKIVGLRDFVYWLSWFIIYLGLVIIISLGGTFTLCYLQVFKHTSYILVFLLIFLFGSSVIMISFMLTPFFDKAKTAGVLGSFAVTLVSLLYFVQVFVSESQTNILWILSLISPTAFALAMDKALVLDLAGNGASFNTLWSGPGFTIGNSLLMLAFDIVLYGLITFYLDSVWPSEFGSKNHPLFCLPFLNRYGDSSLGQREEDLLTLDSIPRADVEEVSEQLRENEAIKIVRLHKTFSVCNQPPVNALNGVDLTIYENEITAVLGQNGAGKSTLFNILSGLTSPTAGTAYVFNQDIRIPENMTEIQRMTGVCPQSDILFEDLTAREHLIFFGRIKCIKPDLLKTSVEKILQDVDLEDKADSYSKGLSGGQKRKLSIAIAIIGDPKIIILDEPTAGVDAYTKRHIWTLLQNIKPNKVILLTTHFMEEADIVADRKAIICNGKLRCCGTSLFLKNRFGIGSLLMLEVDNADGCSSVIEVVKRHVPSAELSHAFGKEMYFILPNESMNHLVPLLYFIENEIKSPETNVHISNYSVSMSSLEQVFLKLTSDSVEITENECSPTEDLNGILQNQDEENENRPKKDVEMSLSEIKVEYEQSSFNMMRALLRLRLLRIFRESHHIIFLVVFPLIFIACGFTLNNADNSKKQNSTLHFSPETYTNLNQLAVYKDQDVAADELLTKLNYVAQVTPYNGSYESLLAMKPLLGALNLTKCCNPDKLNFTIIYNDTMQHSLPIIINLLNNAVFRTLFPTAVQNDSDPFSIEAQQLPLPFQKFSPLTMGSSFLIGLSFAQLPVSLILDIVYDRESKTKHLLHVNGLSRTIYFFVSVIVLGVSLLIVSFIILTVMFYFNFYALGDSSIYLMMGLIVAVHCPAAILFVICLSYLFNRLQTAQSFLPTIVPFIGLFSFIILLVCDIFGLGKIPHTLMSLTDIVYVPFSMLYFLNRVAEKCRAQYSCTQPSLPDYFTPEIITLLLGSLIQIPLWGFVVITIDYKKSGGTFANYIDFLLKRKRPRNDKKTTTRQCAENDDEDIQAEREKVLRIINNEQEIVPVAMVQNLTKEFKGRGPCCKCCCEGSGPLYKLAVSDLSFAVDRGEVFGLLGHNGAGKTTTIKIITGEELPTDGNVWINGMTDLVGVEGMLGYCPQHDAQWVNLTVREHIEIYATIRGVPLRHLDRVVEAYLKGLRMCEHADKKVQQCSGGTRRKLSFAIAMIGNTSAVLLDEPSTGMDTLSKRFLWNTIRNSFQENRGAILTTHSMEEADALCSRVGIMASGKLRCIGTTQYLKTHYGGGYILELKLEPSANKTNFEQFILSKFSDSVIKENVMDRLIFNIPQQSIASLAEAFDFLEQVKVEMGIVMYSFYQTNLEHVFLNLAAPDETLPSNVIA